MQRRGTTCDENAGQGGRNEKMGTVLGDGALRYGSSCTNDPGGRRGRRAGYLPYPKGRNSRSGRRPRPYSWSRPTNRFDVLLDGGDRKKTATINTDLLKGTGTFYEYSVITDQEGSTLFIKGGSTATPMDDGKKNVIEGKIECTGGTGKYGDLKEPAPSKEHVSVT